jgi:RNA polymerase sigma factor (sigma-70 family)
LTIGTPIHSVEENKGLAVSRATPRETASPLFVKNRRVCGRPVSIQAEVCSRGVPIMAREDLHGFVQNLCRRLGTPGGAGTSDAELLDRWVAARDEAAFELLLRRHAPLVLGVCRRLLHRPQDVEDAFQAAFLLLVRKAASIRRGQAVGSWLYKVTYRVALRARSSQENLPARTPPDLATFPAPPDDELLWRDLRPVLDDEVQRLPEKYRSAFVLCHLQGLTNQEAADALGCPLGTVLSRLSWARQRLRSRLTRRGLVVSAAGLVTALTENAAPAAVPPTLIQSTLAASIRFSAAPAGTAGATRSSLLADGVSKTMFLNRLKLMTVAAAVLGLLTVCGIAAVHRTEGAPPAPRGTAKPPAPGDTPAKERNWVVVPAAHDGIVEVIGREVKPGEKVPADRLVTVRQGGKMKQYCRLLKGDRVEKGELLARLNDALARVEVDIKKAKVAASEAELRASTKTKEEAKARYDRTVQFSQRVIGSVSAEELSAAKLTCERYIEEEKAKQENVKVALGELAQAKTLLEMHEIRSPATGVVEVIHKKDAEAVKRLEPVFRIRLAGR